MAKVIVNGIQLSYLQTGNRQDLVMIHGLGANSAFWYPGIVKNLAEYFRVTVYDLRGHGYSEMPSIGYTSLDMAKDLNALLDELNIEKAHLVGHSFGGTVALHYAVLFPERVNSLILADAIVRVLQPSQRASDWSYWNVWKMKLEELGIHFSDDDNNLDFSLLEKLSASSLEGYRTRVKKEGYFLPFGLCNSRRSVSRFQQLMKNTSVKEEIKLVAGLTKEKIAQVCIPVLAVYGEHSFCLDSCHGLQSTLPQCSTVIIPRVGHFHPVVSPDLFIQAVKGFLPGSNYS